MRSCLLKLLLIIGLSSSVPASWGAVVPGLFKASSIVADQTEQERDRGFGLALNQVLLRLLQRVPEPDAQQLRSASGSYVAQFSYTALTADEVERIDLPAWRRAGGEARAEATPTHRLRVTFNEALLVSALRKLGLNPWDKDRPQTLVWLAVNHSDQQYLLAGSQQNAVRSALVRAASRYGLPLLLPQMDAVDKAAVSAGDIRGGFVGEVRRASARYVSDQSLAGLVMQDEQGRWSFRWTLFGRGQTLNWSGAPSNLTGAFDQGIGELAQAMLRITRTVAEFGDTAALKLRVSGVANLADYAKVWQFLQNLAGVQAVQTFGVDDRSVVFSVEARGGLLDLERRLQASQLLQSMPSLGFGASSAQDADLQYRLLR